MQSISLGLVFFFFFLTKFPVRNFYQPFVHLTFDEDLRKEENQDEHNEVKNKKHRKTKNHEESSHLQWNDGRQSTRTKFTEEVLLLPIIFFFPFLNWFSIFLVDNGWMFVMFLVGCFGLQGCFSCSRCDEAKRDAVGYTFCCIWNLFPNLKVYNAVTKC